MLPTLSKASNLCTYIAKGNVALSVIMTTATTISAIFMTPLLCKWLLGAIVPVNAMGIAVSTIQVSSVVSGVWVWVRHRRVDSLGIRFVSKDL